MAIEVTAVLHADRTFSMTGSFVLVSRHLKGASLPLSVANMKAR